jgi:AbiV family abortive infection protein
MLSRAAYDVAHGAHVDWKRLDERFRDHASKTSHALVIEALAANAVPRLKTTHADAKALNTRKNASLYVDLTATGFQRPVEAITAQQAADLVGAAADLVCMLQLPDKARRGDWRSLIGSSAFEKLKRVVKTLTQA